MFFLRRFAVQGRSMEPFYRDGDYVVVLTKTAALSVGDTVVINKGGQSMLKRIAAAPGQNTVPGLIKDGEYFVLSDNPIGTDSRQFGPVKRDEITGKVIWHVRKSG
ncbi:MAG: S24/S26 family peptidase [Candidatus Aenigmarchaeota archaeon]|nr:S24/S26 family peptidase [Candidatus Aenigmarchaeota archaeon]